MPLPILYSERLCPYSLRARLALKYAGINFELREIDRNHLPEVVYQLSEQGTLPLLQLNARDVLDDSLAIMHWALLKSDPDGWLDYEIDALEEMQGLMHINDNSFARDVMSYVHWQQGDRPRDACRKDCELFLTGLEEHLEHGRFLFGDRVSQADFAILPFVYLFAAVKTEWFRAALYPNVWKWLDYHTQSPLFKGALGEAKMAAVT